MLIAITLLLLASVESLATDDSEYHISSFDDVSVPPSGVSDDALLLLVLQLSQDMREMKNDVKGIKEDVSSVQDDVGDLKDDVNDIQLNVLTLAHDVNQLENSQQTVNPPQSQPDSIQDDVEALQQDVIDLKKSTMSFEENMEELNATVVDLQLDPCYHYDITPAGAGLSWDAAREYCLGRGGDLAYHGVENLYFRWKIATDFGHRDAYYYYWFGLQYVAGEWTYLDGTVPSDDIVHWYTSNGDRPSDDNSLNKCALWYTYRNSGADLLTGYNDCNYVTDNNYGVCEYYQC